MASTDHTSGTGARFENQERWRTHVLAQQRSSLTQREYCQVHALTYASFTRWRRLLLGFSTSPRPRADTPGFVPVIIEQEPVSTAPERDDDSVSVVLSSGIRIEGITADSVPAALALAAAL